MGIRLLYYILLKPLSYMPMGVLYVVSNAMYLIMFYIAGYRKKVVFGNLECSFPMKTEAERLTIAKKFYHHLCDLMVESIKMHSMSDKQVRKRMRCVNPGLLEKYRNRTVALIGGHYSNWEWYAAFASLHTPQQAVALYTPVRSKFLDKKLYDVRSRFGLKMRNMKQLASVYRMAQQSPLALIFATDQSPRNPQSAHWMTFLNQKTGVLTGTEHFARRGDYPVIYGELRKNKRGHYEVEYSVLFENSAKTKPGEITEAHTRALENTIIKRPELWLWSHKRWKHSPPEGMDSVTTSNQKK
jgi:KDO2-lipid IV(A) lauroyltransferase